MEKKKINNIQFLSLLFFIIDAPLTGMNLTNLFKNSGVDSYLSILFAAIINIPFLLVFKFLYNYCPDLTLAEKIKELCGKKIGLILNIVIILLIRIFGAILFYNLTDFIVSQFLPDTPAKIIGIVFVIAIIYTTSKGIEVITRMSFLLLGIITILFIISIIGLLPTTNLSNLKPFLEFGINKPFLNSFSIILINYVPLFTLLCVPRNQIIDNQKHTKYFIFMYILATIMMMLTIIVIIGNMGINLATIYEYPEYIVLKRINLFDFLDRIENILAIQRILKLYIVLCLFTYYITNSLDKSGKKLYISIITVISMFISSQIFRSNTHYNNFITNYISDLRGIFLLIIILIFIILLIKKEKRVK